MRDFTPIRATIFYRTRSEDVVIPPHKWTFTIAKARRMGCVGIIYNDGSSLKVLNYARDHHGVDAKSLHSRMQQREADPASTSQIHVHEPPL